jgi:hypothetical protein
VLGNGFDMSNGGVCHGENSPLTPQDTSTSGKQYEIIVPVGITSGVEGNDTKGLGFESIHRGIIFENLDVASELKQHFVIIRKGHAGDKGRRRT